MEKLLIICGPTATGKTPLGIKLAKKLGGEIISVDSRQVYQGMDIGTGKDLPGNSKLKTQNSKLQLKSKNYKIGYYEINGVKVWLYDVVEPDYQFSVADYVRCARIVIEDIWRRNKTPILTGGTGFYIKAVVNGIGTAGVAPDWKLREKLGNYEIRKLRNLLKKIAPERLASMNQSDRQNPRRLIRAIEIALKNPKSLPRRQAGKFQNVVYIGLTAPREVLYKRIDRRVEERVKQGVVEEIKKLLKKGYYWDDPGFNSIGYKEWRSYFEKKADLEEVVQRWKYAEHAYCRRQLTWFKKEKRIKWFDITKVGQKQIFRFVIKYFLV